MMLALAALVLAMTQAPSTEARCEPVAGVEALDAHRIVAIGEYHGSVEIPRLFADVVCSVVERHPGQQIVVGLELPRRFNRIFSRISRARRADVIRELEADSFWDEFRDGRHGLAMLALVRSFVGLSAETGGRVVLTAFEQPRIDEAAAAQLAEEISQRRDPRVLLLMGNAHARHVVMPGQDIEPLVKNLTIAGHDVASFDIVAGGGQAWFCAPECGARPIPRTGAGRERRIVIAPGFREGAYDGYYEIPELSISPPAR